MVQTWTYLARLCVWTPNDPVLLFFRYICLYQLQAMLCSDKKYFQNLCNLNQYRFILPLHDHYGCCGGFFKYYSHIWTHREISSAILLVNIKSWCALIKITAKFSHRHLYKFMVALFVVVGVRSTRGNHQELKK